MNVNSLLQALQQGVLRTDQRFVLTPDGDFAAKLTLGQVLKGKVLRHYEGGRYAVSFDGQEKVVDSAVPLRTGEILYGRVIGVGDKVQLQRVFPGNDATQRVSPQPVQPGFNKSAEEAAALKLFEQYQAELNPLDLQVLGKLMRSVPQPDMMALSGLILSKIGLRFDPLLLRSLHRVLGNNRPSLSGKGEAAVSLAASEQVSKVPAGSGVIEQLAALMATRLNQEPQQGMPQDAGGDEALAGPAVGFDEKRQELHEDDAGRRDRQEWELGRFLLNVQGGGSVAHRVRSLPIWFGDRLVEVDIALYSQLRQGLQQEDGIRYQKVVFSLDTDSLGHVEISAHVANRNLRLVVASDNEFATEQMTHYLPELKAALAESGWRLDEISYETVENDLSGNVLGSVVEHHISQDSLSRLM